MNTGRKELLDEVEVLKVMIDENPCNMQSTLLKSIADTIQGLFSHYIINGASRDSVAKYFNVDVRTITRWKKEYPDFPKPGHFGHKEISYSWIDIVKWKLKHKDLH